MIFFTSIFLLSDNFCHRTIFSNFVPNISNFSTVKILTCHVNTKTVSRRNLCMQLINCNEKLTKHDFTE